MIRQNIKSLILLTIFSVSFSSNLLSIKESTDSLSERSKKTFYLNDYNPNPWIYLNKIFILSYSSNNEARRVFLEKMLKEELSFVGSKTDGRIRKLSEVSFFVPFVLISILRKNCCDISFIPSVFLGTFFGSINEKITNRFWSYLFKDKIKKERILTMFDFFFQKYNVKLKEDFRLLNTKKFLPEEFHSKFDLMYKNYKVDGINGISKECLYFYDSIVKIIKLDIKKNKNNEIVSEKNKI